MYNLSRVVFFNDTATTEIYTLSLHDALPISGISTEQLRSRLNRMVADGLLTRQRYREVPPRVDYELTERARELMRSEEHTSELQSRQYLVCRLLLEKKKLHSHQ